jgi:alpha-L-rhamnosidase
LKDRGNALTAGDIGFRYLLRVLDDAGRSDVIFDMNSNALMFRVTVISWRMVQQR